MNQVNNIQGSGGDEDWDNVGIDIEDEDEDWDNVEIVDEVEDEDWDNVEIEDEVVDEVEDEVNDDEDSDGNDVELLLLDDYDQLDDLDENLQNLANPLPVEQNGVDNGDVAINIPVNIPAIIANQDPANNFLEQENNLQLVVHPNDGFEMIDGVEINQGDWVLANFVDENIVPVINHPNLNVIINNDINNDIDNDNNNDNDNFEEVVRPQIVTPNYSVMVAYIILVLLSLALIFKMIFNINVCVHVLLILGSLWFINRTPLFTVDWEYLNFKINERLSPRKMCERAFTDIVNHVFGENRQNQQNQQNLAIT